MRVTSSRDRRQIDLEIQHALSPEAEIFVGARDKAAVQERRANHQRQRQGDLHDHQRITKVEVESANSYGAGPVLQLRVDVRSCALQGRSEAKEKHRHGRGRDAEKQDPVVEAEIERRYFSRAEAGE